MRIPRLLPLFALVLAAAVPASAEPGAETALSPAPTGTKESLEGDLTLKLAVNDIYGRKTACACIGEIATREYDGLVKALKQEHRITLELTYFMEVFDLEKAILKGSHDGAICKPWTALRLAEQAKADFKRVADLRDPGNSATMTGVFMTLKGSPIQSVKDLAGKRIAFGQEDSFEKYHSPLALLAAQNIIPGKSLNFSSCGENLDALIAGKVDAAVVSNYALTASCAVDFAKPEDFRTLAETESMPLTSVMLDMRKVKPTDALRLQKALIALSGDKVPADLVGKGFVPPVSWKPVAAKPQPKP